MNYNKKINKIKDKTLLNKCNKLNNDLKETNNYVKNIVNKFKKDENFNNNKKYLDQLRLLEEPENCKFMKIKYQEKIKEEEYNEKKKVHDKILEDMFNKEQEMIIENMKHMKEFKEKQEKDYAKLKRQLNLEELEKNKINDDIDKLKDNIKLHEKYVKISNAKLQEIEKEVKELSKYEVFLIFSIQYSDIFEKEEKLEDTIDKMINRYDLLLKKKIKLDNQLKDIDKNKTSLKKEKSNIEINNNNEVIQLNSKKTHKQNQIDHLIKDNKELESKIDIIIKSKQKSTIINHNILLAINNLYLKAKHFNDKLKNDFQEENDGIPIDTENNDLKLYLNIPIKKKLEIIINRISLMKDLIDDVKKH